MWIRGHLGLSSGAGLWGVGSGGLEGVGVEFHALDGVEDWATATCWVAHDAIRAEGHWDGGSAWEGTVVGQTTHLGSLVGTAGVWDKAVMVHTTNRSQAATSADNWELGLLTEAGLGHWHAVVII